MGIPPEPYIREIMADYYDISTKTSQKYPRKRFIFARIRKLVRNFMKGEGERIVLMPGLRGMGKTVILCQFHDYLMRELGVPWRRIFHVSVDELISDGFSVKEAIKGYFNFLSESITSPTSPVFILLDEVPYDPAWEISLKVIHDKCERCFIVATGSSRVKLTSSGDLKRRAREEPIFPLTLTEWYKMKHGKYPSRRGIREFTWTVLVSPSQWSIIDGTTSIYPVSWTDIMEFMKYGGFPVFLELKDNREVSRKIYRLLVDIIEEDIRREKEGMELLKGIRTGDLLYTLAEEIETSFESLSRKLGIKKKEAVRLGELLEKAGMFVFLPEGEGKGRIRIHATTPSIRTAILERFEGQITREKEGYLLEDAVFQILFKRSIIEGTIKTWSSRKSNKHADFIVSIGPRRIAIEVGRGRKDTGQIRAIMSDCNCEAGIIIEDREQIKLEDKQILRVPLSIFLSL